MAKETRDIKQYRIFTLYALVDVRAGTEVVDGKKQFVYRTERRAIAIFDDMDLLNEFVSKNAKKLDGQKGYENGADWVEVPPDAKNYDLAFNPAPVAAEVEAKENTNGAD